ncbi:hypothetical protein GCM10018966_013490 [Streptomyces yanii]
MVAEAEQEEAAGRTVLAMPRRTAALPPRCRRRWGAAAPNCRAFERRTAVGGLRLYADGAETMDNAGDHEKRLRSGYFATVALPGTAWAGSPLTS